MVMKSHEILFPDLWEPLNSENVIGNWFCDRTVGFDGHSGDRWDRVSLYMFETCYRQYIFLLYTGAVTKKKSWDSDDQKI